MSKFYEKPLDNRKVTNNLY